METILVVDDSQFNRKILCEILSKDYLTIEAENGQEAWEILKGHLSEIAAIMLDILMPIMDGFEFLEKINQYEKYKSTPVIVMTGENNVTSEKKALKLGAWDFVPKPYDADIIKFRIKNAIDRSQFSAFKRLKYLSEYDTLTGVYNKSKFFISTMEMLYKNPDIKFMFVRFDIDRFQLINSFYGTEEGDRLLQFVAEQLWGFIGEDTIGTFGRIEADVFGICIPYDERSAVYTLEKSRKILESFNPSYDIVPSYGIYIIEDINTPMDIIYDRASLAAKKCKGNYINCYAFYDEQMSNNLVKEQEIVNNMNNALQNEQFIIYLQPKYDLITNLPIGAEALVRWKMPHEGIIPPGDFIPVFERNGFISKLDYYVWEKVCQLLRKWLDAGKTVTPISVNVSRVNLYNPRLVDIIIELIQKYDLPPELLQLELTESAYSDNPTAMREAMTRLQANGFTIMMDDFGSGYSSLNVLKDIAVDVLKIDMKFLSKTQIVGRGESIIASVVRMAKWLNIPVIAEGAETKEQVDFLRSIGCEFCQGFYFARPMPIYKYELLMENNSQAFKDDSVNPMFFDADMLWSLSPQMEILFNNGLQAVAIYEFDGEHIELIRMNKTFNEIIGSENLNFSLNLIDVINDSYKTLVINAFKTAVDTKEASSCQYLRKSNEGGWIWIDLRLKYINKMGDKYLLFGILTDITMQKEIDIELQRYRSAINKNNQESHTMLIVDDLEISRVVLREIFQMEYNILEAANGKEALDILDKNEDIDIILLDLMMPVMNGKEFLAHKKSSPKIANIPVIMITAEESEEEQVKILEIGVNDYIVKPFVREIVKRRVNNVLESNRSFAKTLKGE